MLNVDKVYSTEKYLPLIEYAIDYKERCKLKYIKESIKYRQDFMDKLENINLPEDWCKQFTRGFINKRFDWQAAEKYLKDKGLSDFMLDSQPQGVPIKTYRWYKIDIYISIEEYEDLQWCNEKLKSLYEYKDMFTQNDRLVDGVILDEYDAEDFLLTLTCSCHIYEVDGVLYKYGDWLEKMNEV